MSAANLPPNGLPVASPVIPNPASVTQFAFGSLGGEVAARVAGCGALDGDLGKRGDEGVAFAAGFAQGAQGLAKATFWPVASSSTSPVPAGSWN